MVAAALMVQTEHYLSNTWESVSWLRHALKRTSIIKCYFILFFFLSSFSTSRLYGVFPLALTTFLCVNFFINSLIHPLQSHIWLAIVCVLIFHPRIIRMNRNIPGKNNHNLLCKFIIKPNHHKQTDGPAIVRINLFVRSIMTISDIKMVSSGQVSIKQL